jgi:hypothetical protein
MKECTLIEVHTPGAEVRIGDLVAVVCGISIKGPADNPHVAYEIAWWDGSTRHSQWVQEFEIAASANGRRMAIGFMKQE